MNIMWVIFIAIIMYFVGYSYGQEDGWKQYQEDIEIDQEQED